MIVEDKLSSVHIHNYWVTRKSFKRTTRSPRLLLLVTISNIAYLNGPDQSKSLGRLIKTDSSWVGCYKVYRVSSSRSNIYSVHVQIYLTHVFIIININLMPFVTTSFWVKYIMVNNSFKVNLKIRVTNAHF